MAVAGLILYALCYDNVSNFLVKINLLIIYYFKRWTTSELKTHFIFNEAKWQA